MSDYGKSVTNNRRENGIDEMKIQLTDLSFTYADRDNKSLSAINLKVKKGECLILAGLSGSGKSTLIRLLAGLIPSFFDGKLAGVVKVAGKDWQQTELWQKAQIVGTVFQTPRNQFFCATVAQELVMATENYGFSPSDIKAGKERTANLMGVSELLNNVLVTLSSGQQQRVAMASVLCLDPPILLLDEPSANLSPDGVAALTTAIREAKAAGTTIIIAEHRFRYLKDLADRLLVMAEGQIIYNGDISLLARADSCREMGLRYEKLSPSLLAAAQATSLKLPTVNDQPLIKMKQAAFRYRKKLDFVWQNLDISLAAGEVVALTGANGCGKTTLLFCLFGLHKLSSGELSKDTLKQAMVLQQPEYQLFAGTVKDELQPVAVDGDGVDNERWLSEFNLMSLARQHPLTLSGGESQRLTLAAAFAQGTEFLLLDEPTSGMDGFHLEKLAEQIKQRAETGCLVVIATHDYDLIELCQPRIIELNS